MELKKGSNKSVALVTGASYGLGAEISKTLARDGFDVGVTELNVNDLSSTLSSIDSENDVQSAGIELDLRSIESIENAVSEALSSGARTPDLGGGSKNVSTTEMMDLVINSMNNYK